MKQNRNNSFVNYNILNATRFNNYFSGYVYYFDEPFQNGRFS